jgi:hypothetical protein
MRPLYRVLLALVCVLGFLLFLGCTKSTPPADLPAPVPAPAPEKCTCDKCSADKPCKKGCTCEHAKEKAKKSKKDKKAAEEACCEAALCKCGQYCSCTKDKPCCEACTCGNKKPAPKP